MSVRVLVLAYQFPPIGGPASQRAVSFVRHLSDRGFECVVITGEGGAGFWSPHDPGTSGRLGSSIEIRRVAVEPPTTARKRLERLFALPSSFGQRFEEEALAAARRAGPVDVVLAELGPYELASTATRLGSELGIPVVADLHDPWALDEMWLYPTVVHRLVDRRRMRRLLQGATRVVMNTQEAARRVLETFPELDPARVHPITCGFDAEDFSGYVDKRSTSFRIVHTGSMHTRWGLRHRRTARLRRVLGGMPVPGVDFLTRSHVYLLEAVASLMREDDDFAKYVEVHFVGPLTDVDRSVAEQVSVTHLHGFRPHDETVRLMRTADVLFLPMQNLPAPLRAGLVPAKTYEYAASGRPVLAAVPDGDARDLLAALGTATVVAPDDVGGMRHAIAAMFERWHQGVHIPTPEPSVLAQYEYGYLTERLIDVLTEALSGTEEPGSSTRRSQASRQNG